MNLPPCWNWAEFIYRIAKPKLAEGQNPDNLTEEQVGVSEGWRLLAPEEIRKGRPLLKDIQRWRGRGWDSLSWSGSSSHSTYRTKKPAGHFLPKKFYRHEHGLFPGTTDYWIERSGSKMTFVHMDGTRREAYEAWGSVEDVFVARRDWVEFDGNPAPFIEKTQKQKDDEAFTAAFLEAEKVALGEIYKNFNRDLRRQGWDAALRHVRGTK